MKDAGLGAKGMNAGLGAKESDDKEKTEKIEMKEKLEGDDKEKMEKTCG